VYSRTIEAPEKGSFFLFGPRGTGKSTWVGQRYPDAVYLDLLDSAVFTELLARPERIQTLVPRKANARVVIDEIQRIPELLNEVHRLIEGRKTRFVLTGSSARKLRRQGVNLLAGRAVTRSMHPLTPHELGADFDLARALESGLLPAAYASEQSRDFLASYVRTYLQEEVLHEGITRNLGGFSRFVEAASLSQGAVLNTSAVARECAIERKVVEGYFGVLEDLLIAVRIPVFTRRAKRRMTQHPKFFLFDVGVYRAIRPKGPLDRPEEIEGAALETLVFQTLRALNDYRGWGYGLYHWRSSAQLEVDLVLYGERGLVGIETKRAGKLRPEDLRGVKAFLADYPAAKACVLYGGERVVHEDARLDLVPLERFLREPEEHL
jgi:predicted AAA+ superfamily ATPase